MASAQYDVVVVGAGLVGLAAALAVRRVGFSAALVAREQSPSGTLPDEGWDSRIYAISPGSSALLTGLGAGFEDQGARVMPVESMRIYGDDGVARLEFSAYEAGLSELAFIVENRLLQQALWRCIGPAGITVYADALCDRLEVDTDLAGLRLDGGATLGARLVVGADGADSWVRAAAGITASVRDYHQHAVVANFACERPHQGVATQWFRRDGVLALLPLPGERASMVWSTGSEHAQDLLALTPEALAAEVDAASAGALGTLTVITPPAAFPLRLQRIARFAGPRVVLIGDAAHNVHPLAGQGVNLGFRDVRALAETLTGPAGRYDCGEHALLRRYERARREDVAAMELTTDGLQKLFGTDSAWVARARNLGLNLVNLQPYLKSLLVRRAVA